MVNRKFNGVDIGDSAVEFFEKLAKLESNGRYDLADQKYYIGKYQIGTDVLMAGFQKVQRGQMPDLLVKLAQNGN